MTNGQLIGNLLQQSITLQEVHNQQQLLTVPNIEEKELATTLESIPRCQEILSNIKYPVINQDVWIPLVEILRVC